MHEVKTDDNAAMLRRRQIAVGAMAAVVLSLSGIVCAATRGPDEGAAVSEYGEAWQVGNYERMYAQTSTGTRQRVPSAQDLADRFREAAVQATAYRWQIGEPKDVGDGEWELPVAVRTRAFGLVRGTVSLRVVNEDGKARIAWQEQNVFPGLRSGEKLERIIRMPPRADLLARDGTPLATGPERQGKGGAAAADIVGTLGPIPADQAARARALGYPDDAQVGQNGLERILDPQLAGKPGGELRAGSRVIGRAEPRKSGPVRSTISPSVQSAAVAALAGRVGGAVALDPRSGEILAVAGIAFSGLQPPGSTFKIITAAGALEEGVTTMGATFPVQTSATLSGVELQNSFGEACGGTLTVSFAKSCNSVFAPLGAKLGAERLVKTAEAFGFNEQPPLAGAATPTIPPADQLGDDLGVGSTAIGQGKLQATALTMAVAAATIGRHGRRPQVTMLSTGRRSAPTSKAVSPATGKRVERLMEAVVKPGGTGTSAAISGVRVAGKTGTAELRSTQGCEPDPADPEACPTEADPANTTAWFAAYAPAGRGLPRVAVAVMLIGAGHGGDTAAPAAKPVLVAGLKTTR